MLIKIRDKVCWKCVYSEIQREFAEKAKSKINARMYNPTLPVFARSEIQKMTVLNRFMNKKLMMKYENNMMVHILLSKYKETFHGRVRSKLEQLRNKQ